jgi:predicted NAD-dependent protein-ADP-ribosyltransferase YbiA (DUF1768 family)
VDCQQLSGTIFPVQARARSLAVRLASRYGRADWDDVKVETMRRIIFAKADQHGYVAASCSPLATRVDRELLAP